MDFTVLADDRIKLKESEKKDEYIDLARELTNLINIKVTVIPIVIGELGTVSKWLAQGLKDLETIQTTALLSSARILRRILETWGDFLFLWPH